MVVVGGLALVLLLRCPAMKIEQFLGPVKTQLMRPPASSEAAIEAALAARELPEGVAYADALQGRGVTGCTHEFDVPPAVPCLGFVQEQGRYDIMRCRFWVQGWQVDLAMSKEVNAIRLSGSDLLGDPLQVAQRVADRVFEPEQGVVLRRVGCDGPVTFGTHDLEATGPASPYGWEHWRDTLAWWYQPGEVGFITIDAYGQPAKVRRPGALEGVNERWFSETQPDWLYARQVVKLFGVAKAYLLLPPYDWGHELNFRIHDPHGQAPPEVRESFPGVRSSYQVPADSQWWLFLRKPSPHRLIPGRYDVVKAADYKVGDLEVAYIHLRHLAAIMVWGDALKGTDPFRKAQRAAQLLFEPEAGVVLREVARLGRTSYGTQDLAVTGPAVVHDGQEYPHWRDALTFKAAYNWVRFVTVKAYGCKPPPEVPYDSREANEHWFDDPPPAWAVPLSQKH